jgi:hypothetical protein
MALGKTACPQAEQALRGEFEKAELVGDGGLRAAQPPGGFFLRKVVGSDEFVQRNSFFPEIQIAALEVFYKSQERGAFFVNSEQNARDFLQPTQLGGPETAFP